MDDILDNPSYAYILKSCGWCITKPITLSNKMQFLQHLVQDEVIAKRERNMKAFVRGLDYLEFGELVRQHPEMTRSLFVAAQSGTISAKVFLSLISANRPESKEHARAFDYFKEFIAYLEGEFYTAIATVIIRPIIYTPIIYTFCTLLIIVLIFL